MAPIKKQTWAQKNATRKLAKKKKLELKAEKMLEAKPKEVENNEKKHFPTITIAVPGSILNNAHVQELKTILAGQIARAACIYKINEVVVYNDKCELTQNGDTTTESKTWMSCVLLGRILQFLECPQYLRKSLFPIHKDLEFVGLLNPLDAPHHLRADEESLFREGVVSEKPAKSGKGCYANIGLSKDVKLDKVIKPGFRVTVKLLPQLEGSKKLKGLAVSPRVPLQENGLYWGYNVRLAKSFTEVIDNCPYKKGYDLMIGTSDKGMPVSRLPVQKNYRHCIIFFGGVDGLEQVFQDDEKLTGKEPATLFNYYVNTCPKQGSRTIRTEEAIFISLAMLSSKLTF